MKKKRTRTLSQTKKELDRVFSLYIRTRDEGVCCACGVKKPIKQMQAGHYISRSKLATRWDEVNVHAECCACNIFKKGNYPAYTVFLEKLYGHGIVEDLVKLSNREVHYKVCDLEEKIAYYKELLKGMNG